MLVLGVVFWTLLYGAIMLSAIVWAYYALRWQEYDVPLGVFTLVLVVVQHVILYCILQ